MHCHNSQPAQTKKKHRTTFSSNFSSIYTRFLLFFTFLTYKMYWTFGFFLRGVHCLFACVSLREDCSRGCKPVGLKPLGEPPANTCNLICWNGIKIHPVNRKHWVQIHALESRLAGSPMLAAPVNLSLNGGDVLLPAPWIKNHWLPTTPYQEPKNILMGHFCASLSSTV